MGSFGCGDTCFGADLVRNAADQASHGAEQVCNSLRAPGPRAVTTAAGVVVTRFRQTPRAGSEARRGSQQNDHDQSKLPCGFARTAASAVQISRSRQSPGRIRQQRIDSGRRTSNFGIPRCARMTKRRGTRCAPRTASTGPGPVQPPTMKRSDSGQQCPMLPRE